MNKEEKQKLLNTIYLIQKIQRNYWVDFYLNDMGSKNVSVHNAGEFDGIESTIIYDEDNQEAVVIETDTTAKTVNQSHKYMSLETEVIAKLAALYKATP